MQATSRAERPVRIQQCKQCYKPRVFPRDFLTKTGRTVIRCSTCRGKYGGWTKLSDAEKVATTAKRRDPKPAGRLLFIRRSVNRKTGPIPVSISERGTCPTSCSLYDAGCYADYSFLGYHWRQLSKGRVGTAYSWTRFLDAVRGLPTGQLWRHNEAGDLAGDGQAIDREKFAEIVEANRGRRGFTYTHRTAPENFDAYQWANLEGFTVNLSTDSLEEADAVLGPRIDSTGLEAFPLPVVVLLPADAPDRGIRTPAGRSVVVCPAQTSEGVTCASCALCAKPFRHSIVGFRSHGRSKNLIPEIVRSKRREDVSRLEVAVAEVGRNPGSVREPEPPAASRERMATEEKTLRVNVTWKEFAKLASIDNGKPGSINWKGAGSELLEFFTPQHLARIRAHAGAVQLVPHQYIPAQRIEEA